jgi:hypothetical protein
MLFMLLSYLRLPKRVQAWKIHLVRIDLYLVFCTSLSLSSYFLLALTLSRMQLDHTEDDYNEESNSSFVLYSLRNHQLVRRLPLSGPPSTFTATNHFIVIVRYLTCLIGVNNSFEFLEWLRHLLYSFFPLPPFKLFILFHQHYLNRSRPYLIIVQQQLAPLILTNNHRT